MKNLLNFSSPAGFSKTIPQPLENSPAARPSPPPALWLVAVLLACWFSLFLGNRPFASPDEGRYVEIPREMVVSGDYITPRLNGVKYFEKPPLFYWIQAASIKAFGIQEWAMRLGCVFFAILGCLGTYLFGRRFYGAASGRAACLILATSPLYYALSRLIILDMAITALVSLSLFSFFIAVHTPAGRPRRFWAWGFYSLSALGVMTKGLMALAIPGPVILIWALYARRWKDLWPAYLPSGMIVFFAIAAPWHILASLKNPEFAYKYFVVEHFMRYTTSLHMRSRPFYFFVPVLLIGFFPWVTLLGGALKEGIKEGLKEKSGLPSISTHRDATLFLLIWAGWTFAFFSLSNSKLIPYILPCFPPLALIMGSYCTKMRFNGSALSTSYPIKFFACSATLLGLSGLGILMMMPQLIDHRPHLWVDLTILASLVIVFAAAALFFLHRSRPVSFFMLPLTATILVMGVIRLMPELQRPSIKPLAHLIKSIQKPGDIIGSYKCYYQDLPPYLNQTVTVVDTRGELEFGCEAENCSPWMVTEKEFLSLWHSPRRLLFVARLSEVNALSKRETGFHYSILGEDQGNILFTNKKGLY